MERYILGVDIGGTNVRAGAVDLNGEVHFPCRISSDALRERGEMLDHLRAFLRSYIEGNGLEGKLLAMAIGFPSPVNREKRIVYNCPNLQNDRGGFDGRDIVAPLEGEFGVPVFIEKDSVFLLQYELVHSSLEAMDAVLGIYYGTGIGYMVYLNGQFLSGKHGAACDLGHVPFYGSDRICACGNRGCAECYASGRALREIRERHFPDTPMEALFARHRDAKVLRDFVEAMAVLVAAEVNVFDPDCVVLGGGIVDMPEFPIESLKRCVREFVRRPYPGDDFRYIQASSAVDIGVIGGALYAMRKLGLGAP